MASNGFGPRSGRGGRGMGRGRGRGGGDGGERKGPRVSKKLFVGNLPETVRISDLKTLFGQFGTIDECDIVKDYAFIHFTTEQEAQTAVDNLHESDFHGSQISVELSYSKVRQKPGMGDKNECYRCGKSGHWSKDCPQGGSLGPMRRGSDRGGRGGGGGGSRGLDRPLPPRRPLPGDYYGREELLDRDPYALYRDRYPPPPPLPPSLSDRYRRYDPYERRLPPREYIRDPYARPPPDYYSQRPRSYEPYARSRYDLLPSRVTPPRRIPPP